jgi:hypothetical protein
MVKTLGSLAVSALASLPAISAAQTNCRSDLIYVGYNECPVQDHVHTYREGRSEVCGVDTFKRCQQTFQVTSYKEFWYPWTEQKPNGNAGFDNCRLATNNPMRPNQAFKEALAQARALHPEEQYSENWDSVNIEILGGAYETWAKHNHRAECKVRYTFSFQGVSRDPVCGVESYSLCRDKSFGIESTQKRFSKCGLDWSQISIASNPNSNMPGQNVCWISWPATQQVSAGNLSNLEATARRKDLFTRPALQPFYLQVLLELKRAGVSKYDKDIEATVSQLGGVELLFNRWIETPLKNAFAVQLAASFPAEMAEISKKQARNFATVSPAAYAVLFPNGVNVPADQLDNLSEQLDRSTDGSVVFRSAEALVRAKLSQFKVLRQKSLKLMDARTRILSADISFDGVLDEIRKIEPNQVERVRNEAKRYNDSLDALKQAAKALFDAQLRSNKSQSDQQLDEVWDIIRRSKERSNDPRVAILDGYKALVQLNPAEFAKALRSGIQAVAGSRNPDEARVSIRLLDQSAIQNLEALKSLSKAFQNTASVQDSITSTLLAILEKQAVADDVVIGKVTSIIQSFAGGPGSLIALEAELATQIELVYGQFSRALAIMPELNTRK